MLVDNIMVDGRVLLDGCTANIHLNKAILTEPLSALSQCRGNVDAKASARSFEQCVFRVKELQWGKEYEAQLETLHDTHDIVHYTDTPPEGRKPQPLHFYDFIIGSDLTYAGHISHALFWTVRQLLVQQTQRRSKMMDVHPASEGEEVKFITSHECRLQESTRLAVKTAQHFGLQHTVLKEHVGENGKHSVWQFQLADV